MITKCSLPLPTVHSNAEMFSFNVVFMVIEKKSWVHLFDLKTCLKISIKVNHTFIVKGFNIRYVLTIFHIF